MLKADLHIHTHEDPIDENQIKYRGWKSDKDTLEGKYSKEFLSSQYTNEAEVSF